MQKKENKSKKIHIKSFDVIQNFAIMISSRDKTNLEKSINYLR